MLHAAYLMPLLPLAGFVVLAAFGRRLGDPWAGWLGTATVAGSFVVACIVYAGLLAKAAPQRSFTQDLFTWIPVGGLQVHAALLIDPLSMTMALFVTGVSSLIHLYSIGYMKGDRDYAKFFLYLNLFVASMLILVLANNLLFTFVGWEGVGVCSYWLVSFWFGRDSAASAGKKAFLYNRLADVGFLIAVFLVFSKTGTLNYKGIFSHLSLIGGGTGTAICLLLFVAAVGKSAQLPLFPWLADAMEGPTPVSALIHAATMVTAGVYLMCRISPVLSQHHVAQLVVASVGAATAFVAATIGCAQQDIKKVLAYSTVSQLGYMFLAVGTGAYEAAIFLMVAHAFFKALLFLGAGSVIHGLHDEQDLKRMGNLRRYMKLTFFTFGIGTLAIAGIPPLSGFFAKGDILDNAYARYPVLWAIGLVTAALTAYYMTRLVSLAFYGDDRWRQGAGAGSGHGGGAEPHESPWVMALPLVVLAVLAFFGGVLHLPWQHSGWNPLGWLGPVFGAAQYEAHQSSGTQWALAVVDSVVALVGLGVAFSLWTRRRLAPRARARGAAAGLLPRRHLRRRDRPARTGLRPLLRHGGRGRGHRRRRERRGSSHSRRRGSLRRVQTGYVRQYALGIVLGAVLLLAWMISRAVS